MGSLGVQEMFGIFLIALLLFGPKKLPELGRLLGKGLTEFRRAKNELRTTFETHMRELEREANLSDQQKSLSASSTQAYSPSISSSSSSSGYTYPYEDSHAYPEPAEISTHVVPRLPSAEEDLASAPSSIEPALYDAHGVPVNGTIARGSGIQPLPVPATLEEERPA